MYGQKKHDAFMNMPIKYDTPPTAIPGIGDRAASYMEERGINRAQNLMDMYGSLRTQKLGMAIRMNGVNTGCVKRAVDAIREKCSQEGSVPPIQYSEIVPTGLYVM